MLKGLRSILSWLQSGGLNLLFLAGGLILVWGTLAPVGTLVWWADRGAEQVDLFEERYQLNQTIPRDRAASESAQSTDRDSDINCYIVFLTGVGDTTADQVASGEEKFLDRLDESRPSCVTVRDVFPYSAANDDVLGQSLFTPFWEFASEAEGWFGLTRFLLETRNVWRMAISVDDRYGPVYNRGIAMTIVERMEKQHPIPRNPAQPIRLILIGTSGGAQVSLGATPYLDRWLNAEINIVSVGGVFDGTRGFEEANQIYHLTGRQDWIDNIGAIVFPPRWRWTVGSPINRARRDGRYTVLSSGPHEHEGSKGYFGEDTLPDQDMKYLEVTLERVQELPIWPASTAPKTSNN